MSSKIEERWLPVVDYEGLYEVSDLGRVRSLDRVTTARDGRQMRWRGRLLIATNKPAGYPGVTLSSGGVHKSYDVHFLVARAFLGERPLGKEIRHLNGNASDPRLANLAYVTHRDNELDKRAHGTHHNGRKTVCKYGHPLGPPNVRPSKENDTWRHCWACDKARSSRTYARQCNRPFDFQAAADRYYQEILQAAQQSTEETVA